MAEQSDKIKVDKYVRVKRVALIVVILLIILLPLSFWLRIDTNSHLILRTAKNVRMSMILTGIDYYGKGISEYDPTSADGFADGALDEVRQGSSATGDITLTSWNEDDNSPRTFIYREGNYYVEYTGNRTDASFKIYYTWNVLNYDSTESTASS